MSEPPPLGVLLPVRNGGALLSGALRSLTDQTFPDFEVWAVDDGSTDGTLEVLREQAARDRRFHVLERPAEGIVSALEAARVRARSPYLARMDADDVADPRRFERQMELMKDDRRIVLCGTGVKYVPRDAVRGGALRYERWLNGLVTHEEIERDLFVECPVPHPTFLLRADALAWVGGYRDPGWPEDYDLLLRLWEAGGRFAKVPEVLLSWREGPGRLSRTDLRYTPDRFRACKVHYLLRTHLRGERPVLVWGAGPIGKGFAREILRRGRRVEAFVDLDPRKIGQVIHGAPVISPPEASRHPSAFFLAAVGQSGAREEIRRALEAVGRTEVEDFVAVA